MEINAFLADAAVVADGKLYIQGAAWNSLSASVYPARHPRMSIALAISVPYGGEDRDHQFALRLEDADGGSVLQTDGKDTHIAGTFRVSRSAAATDGDEQVVPLAINLDGLVFPAPGRYRFVLAIDGSPVKHLPFQLVDPAAATAG